MRRMTSACSIVATKRIRPPQRVATQPLELGSAAAWIVLGAGLSSGSPMLANVGHAGVLINLFNLIPADGVCVICTGTCGCRTGMIRTRLAA